jgi:hypothetical protein
MMLYLKIQISEEVKTNYDYRKFPFSPKSMTFPKIVLNPGVRPYLKRQNASELYQWVSLQMDFMSKTFRRFATENKAQYVMIPFDGQRIQTLRQSLFERQKDQSMSW